MKEQYFIGKGGETIGPLSLEQIRNEIFFENTLIWKASYKDWKPATDVEELKEYITLSPPSLPLSTEYKNNSFSNVTSNTNYAMLASISD